MASKAEEHTSRVLRAILAELPIGAAIVDSLEFRDVLTGLEWFLPDVLQEAHPEWSESLDGIYSHIAHKTGECEAEILGICCLMSDQSLTPIHVRLQICVTSNEISWLELRLGEKGKRGMVRRPYPTSGTIYKRLHDLREGTDVIDWVYKVTFGQKRA